MFSVLLFDLLLELEHLVLCQLVEELLPDLFLLRLKHREWLTVVELVQLFRRVDVETDELVDRVVLLAAADGAVLVEPDVEVGVESQLLLWRDAVEPFVQRVDVLFRDVADLVRLASLEGEGLTFGPHLLDERRRLLDAHLFECRRQLCRLLRLDVDLLLCLHLCEVTEVRPHLFGNLVVGDLHWRWGRLVARHLVCELDGACVRLQVFGWDITVREPLVHVTKVELVL